MKQAQEILTVLTSGEGFYDITADVGAWVSKQSIEMGLLVLFIQHTSASLLIQENADPDVMKDMGMFLKRLVSEDPRQYRHTIEGPDDMPAHIRCALTGLHLTIPVRDGRPALGIWQGIYVAEHRALAHTRRVVMHVMGD